MGPAFGKASAREMRTDDVPEERSLAYVGMVVFLGAWVMLFGALFFSYAVLRVSAPIWPPPRFERLPLVLPGIATLLLLASSGTLALALARWRGGQLARGRNGLLATIALGVAFGGLQCEVWKHLWKGGLHLGSGAHGGTFYVLTGFHFIHVLVGLVLLARLLAPLVRRVPVAPARVPAALTAMFWHFVGAVGLTTFVAVYLI